MYTCTNCTPVWLAGLLSVTTNNQNTTMQFCRQTRDCTSVNVKCPWSQIMMSSCVSMSQFSSWVTKYKAHISSECIMGHPVQHYCQSKSFSLHDFFKLPDFTNRTNVNVDYDSVPCHDIANIWSLSGVSGQTKSTVASGSLTEIVRHRTGVSV